MECKPVFEKLIQIGIVVRDIEATVKNYEALGMGPWEVMTMSNDKEPFTDLTFNGKPIEPQGDVLKIAILRRFGMEIELYEPIADSVYKEWLDEHGPGLHHLAFLNRDSYSDILSEHYRQTGKEPWLRAQGIHGKMDFATLDLREQLGLMVKCYGDIDENKEGHPF